MKLAAVNPELNFDIEQILSKDIFQSRDGGVINFGLSSLHPRLDGPTLGPGELQHMKNSVEMLGNVISQFPPMTQISSVWDDELQSVLQLGFIPNAPLDGLDINGSMKDEM
ncbi:Transcription factor bHLH49 [Acorus calamus]|uniref:Transcription factor bHLH49 n=1 Tax=Acorus calamus TaxID=4465 RepID=A0AAV9DIF9_ACOCL|nr:Transcription factor bHLH49 [Acorus calamus]